MTLTLAELRNRAAEYRTRRRELFGRLEREKENLPSTDYFDDAEDFKLGLLDKCPPNQNPAPSLCRALRPEAEAGAAEDQFMYPEDWEMTLSNPYRAIVLYYDPKRKRTKTSREKLLRDAKKKHPDRHFRLQPLRAEDLVDVSISPFVLAERHFEEFGHVSEIDCRKFGVGKKHGSTARVERNINVARTNSLLWKGMLRECYKSLALPIDAKLDDEREQELDELVAHIVGNRTRKKAPVITEYDKRPRQLATILHGGLLLGSSAATEQVIYATMPTSPGTTGKEGRHDTARKILFGSGWPRSQAQISFELANAHRLFGGRRRSATEEATVMTGAVVTWFSQVIMAQRRVAWRSKISTDGPLVTKELQIEKRLHGKVAGLKRLSWRTGPKHLKDPIGDLKHNLKLKHKANDVVLRLSLEDRILASLHGSMVDHPNCSEYDFFNNGYQLLVVAGWIGSLKRTGEATIDEGIGRHLRMSRAWIERDGDGNHLFGQFSKETWDTIFETAQSVRPQWKIFPTQAGKLPRISKERDAVPVKVRYEWVTADTIGQSGTCVRRARSLTIFGPMLCFPTNQQQYWIEKSAVIRELKGFEVLTDFEKKRRADARRKRLDT